MSKPFEPKKVLLFTAVLVSKDLDISKIMDVLSKKIGRILFCSRKMAFIWSDYYQTEMGEDLNRVFVVYEKKIKRDELVKYKKLCDSLELKYSKDDKRTVNIDPGIITPENVVLATNKAFFHRIYIKNGVYGELTLFYRKNTYNPIEYWTFPEYRSSLVVSFFNRARNFIFDH
jgi:hypothetical protein